MPRNVRQLRPRLEKGHAKQLVAASLSRMVADHGLAVVAEAAGCHPRTLRNAMGLDALPEFHTLLNLLALSDGTVLDELLAHLGWRLVPLDGDAGCDRKLLAEAAGLLHEMADALADGRIDHIERARIVKKARPLEKGLGAMVAQFDRAKVAA